MKKLTAAQRYLLSQIVDRVLECMGWDEDIEGYTDMGNFILQLDTDQMNDLRAISEKL